MASDANREQRGKVRRLSSGWWRLETQDGHWAQVPPDFTRCSRAPDWEDSSVPDRFISNPEWRREEINAWWRECGEAMLQEARAQNE